jgi:hypothetical protein
MKYRCVFGLIEYYYFEACAFRREYAKNRYEELVKEKGFNAKDYRGYDSSVLKELSKDLGHERIDVVIYICLK